MTLTRLQILPHANQHHNFDRGLNLPFTSSSPHFFGLPLLEPRHQPLSTLTGFTPGSSLPVVATKGSIIFAIRWRGLVHCILRLSQASAEPARSLSVCLLSSDSVSFSRIVKAAGLPSPRSPPFLPAICLYSIATASFKIGLLLLSSCLCSFATASFCIGLFFDNMFFNDLHDFNEVF